MTQPPSESEVMCLTCGHRYGLHRATDNRCPTQFDKHGFNHDWLTTYFKSVPMTAEQVGPRQGSFGEFYKNFAEFQLKTPYQYFAQENGLYSFKSPTVCAIDQTLKEVQETQLVGGYAYEAGYAQGRKSRDEELKTVAPTEASVQASAAKDEAIAEMRNHLDITVNAANLALRAMSVNKPKDAESILRGIVAGISEALAKTEEQRK